MKHLILVTVIVLSLNYFTPILCKKNSNGFEIEVRRKECRSSGGYCILRKKTCDVGYEVLKNGKPHCSKKRKCCAPKALSDVICGTEDKCGQLGGFCIIKNEYCTYNNVIQGPGLCSDNGSCKCCLTPTVYMQDIENAIVFALRDRAVYKPIADKPKQRKLNHTEQIVLKSFVQALHNYLPLKTDMKSFLNCLGDKLPQPKTINGSVLLHIYNDCEKVVGFGLPKLFQNQWIGCRNTKNHLMYRYRSYPCGLWTTFHTMSVNLRTNEDAKSLLQTIHGLVNYFPWCQDCKHHFLNMSKGSVPGVPPAEHMTTIDDVTKWLWSAHNAVTNRTITEPTNYTNTARSHLQFPGSLSEQCPECRDVATCPMEPGKFNPIYPPNFNQTEVLKFLRRMYSRTYIVVAPREETRGTRYYGRYRG